MAHVLCNHASALLPSISLSSWDHRLPLAMAPPQPQPSCSTRGSQPCNQRQKANYVRCSRKRFTNHYLKAVPADNSSTHDNIDTPYSLEQTKSLVETAMLAAVSGLAYVVSTILKLENSLGYFLPLPIVLSTMRSGIGAGWRTMMATGFLLVVLLGPLRAVSYLLLHGTLAATLGTFWCLKVNWWMSVLVGAIVRMMGQLLYMLLSSVTMNENLFAMVLSNVYSLLDHISASLGASGAPSMLAVVCMIFALLLVNGICYCFLLHVFYRVILSTMGYDMGPMPGIINKYLGAGVVQVQRA